MNVVNLSGRLCHEPKVMSDTVVRFTLAVQRDREHTDFISCVAFGKSAEFAKQYLHKGMKIIVQGEMRSGSYLDKATQQRTYCMDVDVRGFEFCESKQSQPQTTQPAQVDAVDTDDEEELPFY